MNLLENELRIIYQDIMLVLPCEELREDICEFKAECIDAAERHIQGSAHLEMYEIEEWLKRINEKRTLPASASSTPSETYLAYSRESGRLIGCCQLRLHMTDGLKRCGANIGYEVRPSERKKGYGKMILRALLKKAGALGLKEVFVDCDICNTASRRTVLACGGTDETLMKISNKELEETFYRYRIIL